MTKKKFLYTPPQAKVYVVNARKVMMASGGVPTTNSAETPGLTEDSGDFF